MHGPLAAAALCGVVPNALANQGAEILLPTGS